MAKAASPVPSGYSTLMPHLMLHDAARTIDWYKRAFGAEEIGRSPGPDGKIMHAELVINGSRFFVNDVMHGIKGPKDYGGSPIVLWIYCDDSDTMYNRAIAAGAKTGMGLDNQFWGDRAGSVVDPEGYTWWIATRKEDLSQDEMRRRAEEFFKQMAPQSR